MKYKIFLIAICLLMGINNGFKSNLALADAGAVDDNSVTAGNKEALTYKYLNLVNLSTIELKGTPQKAAISPRGNFILVPATDFNNLYYISINKGKAKLDRFTIPTGEGPTDVVISNNARRAYVTNEMDNTVSVISLDNENSSTIATINSGMAPYTLTLSSDNRYLYVVNRGENTVSVIDLSKDDYPIINKLNVGNWPNSIKISNNGKMAYVVNRGDNTVTSIDLTVPQGKVLKKQIAVGTFPIDIALNKSGDLALVTNALDNNVSLFNPLEDPSIVFGSINGYSRPFGIVSDPKEEIAMAVNSNVASIDFLDLKDSSRRRITDLRHDNIIIGDKPEFITLNRSKKIIAITHPAKSLLTVITYNLKHIRYEIPAVVPEPPTGPLPTGPVPNSPR